MFRALLTEGVSEMELTLVYRLHAQGLLTDLLAQGVLGRSFTQPESQGQTT
jgi:hypothetical protein